MANYDIPQYPTKRLRYFNNQFLNDQDFIDDDATRIAHERAVLRSLCVAGVCEGLVVTYPASNKPPSVSAGIAIDKTGRMIVIDQPTDGLANPSALADGDYFVHISFLESADNKATGQGAADYTRWKQTPAINASAKTAALPGGVVVLGSCTVKTGAFVGSGTTVGRQYSGLRLPGPNKDVTATLRNSGASDDLAVLAGALMVRRDVAGQQGPTLTLQNSAGSAGAGGAIDFNGYDPGTNDPSARVRSLDDGASSSHLTFSTKQPGNGTNKLVERLRITNTGNVGIGTQAPTNILHVRAADAVGLFESSTTQATLRLATSEGTANQVMLANRSGGNAAISVGSVGDALLVNKDGHVVVSKAQGGVGDLTVENYLRFPNEGSKDKIIIWDSAADNRYGMGLNSWNINLFCPTSGYFSLRQNSATGAEFFSVSAAGAATFFGPIVPKVGNDGNSGIQFPTNPGSGTGDEAFLRYSVTSNETTKLTLGINNDPDDALVLWQGGAERLTIANGQVTVANRLTANGALEFGLSAWGSDTANASIVTDNVNYKAMMIVGSNQNQGHNRWIRMWDDVQVEGSLTVNNTLSAQGGKLGQIGIGSGDWHGVVPSPYETLQLNPTHNLRVFFGTTQRAVLENSGQFTIYFAQGYWRFQNDGNLVKYRNNGTAIWALGSGGVAGW